MYSPSGVEGVQSDGQHGPLRAVGVHLRRGLLPSGCRLQSSHDHSTILRAADATKGTTHKNKKNHKKSQNHTTKQLYNMGRTKKKAKVSRRGTKGKTKQKMKNKTPKQTKKTKKHTITKWRILSFQFVQQKKQNLPGSPFRTAVPFWGQTTQELSGWSPKQNCSLKRATLVSFLERLAR